MFMDQGVAVGAMAPQRKITFAQVLEAVSEHYNVGVLDLKSSSRRRAVARPRQVAMYLGRKLTNLSLTKIGMILNKDHTCVLHAERVVPTFGLDGAISEIKRSLGVSHD